MTIDDLNFIYCIVIAACGALGINILDPIKSAEAFLTWSKMKMMSHKDLTDVVIGNTSNKSEFIKKLMNAITDLPDQFLFEEGTNITEFKHLKTLAQLLSAEGSNEDEFDEVLSKYTEKTTSPLWKELLLLIRAIKQDNGNGNTVSDAFINEVREKYQYSLETGKKETPEIVTQNNQGKTWSDSFHSWMPACFSSAPQIVPIQDDESNYTSIDLAENTERELSSSNFDRPLMQENRSWYNPLFSFFACTKNEPDQPGERQHLLPN